MTQDLPADISLDRSLVLWGKLWNDVHQGELQALMLPRSIRFEDVRSDYTQLYSDLVILPAKLAFVDALVTRVLASKPRYGAAAATSGVPWYVIAIIHSLEAGLNFDKHLHNGDPLTARTVHVPAGRPAAGNPPFTWEESAADALAYDGMTKNADWSTEHTAFEFEQFNGWGYRLAHPSVKSPYLWSFSNQYTKGKYVVDGVWDDDAVSNQCGAMVMLRRITDRVSV